MKKKIRIVTAHTLLDNYGQVLQCYALQRFLRDNYPQFDIKVLNINPYIAESFYVPSYVTLERNADEKPQKQGFLKRLYAKSKAAERVVRTYFHAYIMRREKYIKRLKEQSLEKLLTDDELEVVKKRQKALAMYRARDFVGFERAHIALHCGEMQDFHGYTDKLSADCYIVGSDQVWNDYGTLVLENFYGGWHWIDYFTLKFLPQNHNSKKISYAASLGKREFGSDFEKWYFKDALSKFDAISVRESCNTKTLAELGLNSVCVPDPTQLLSKNDYEKLINSANINERISGGKVRKDSVFVYMLNGDTLPDKDEVMNFLQNKFGENAVIYTNGNLVWWEFNRSYVWDLKCDFAPTPQEWLACVRDCKLMITNSFHGCVFAIIMNTPFVALTQIRPPNEQNIRFDNILEIFDLQNRLVSNLDELKAVMNEPIAWDKINEKLAKWRSVGVNFLVENLGNL